MLIWSIKQWKKELVMKQNEVKNTMSALLVNNGHMWISRKQLNTAEHWESRLALIIGVYESLHSYTDVIDWNIVLQLQHIRELWLSRNGVKCTRASVSKQLKPHVQSWLRDHSMTSVIQTYKIHGENKSKGYLDTIHTHIIPNVAFYSQLNGYSTQLINCVR